MDYINEIRSLLINGYYLLTPEHKSELILQFFPSKTAGYYADDQTPQPLTYKKKTEIALNDLKKVIGSKCDDSDINLTTDYDSLEIPEGSLAYHRVFGTILADSRYWFSSVQFEQDLLAADANPNISCHFVHINSGGGEAYYLDQLSHTMRGLTKPVFTYIRKVCGSAAYYIGCHGNTVKATTQNDIIGCIGTMVEFWDIDAYLESIGFKHIEEYATYSDLKNKKFNDLENGNPKQYIDEELNPLRDQFVSEVQQSRKKLSALDSEKDPILRGETYRAVIAVENGLIDGICTLPDAIAQAYALGLKYISKQTSKSTLQNFL